MNILVTGANGQLGMCIRKAAANCSDSYIFTDVNDLDISNREAINKIVKDNNINAIINCAAYTNVDKAETESALAERLNSEAVRNLAVAMKSVDGTLFHISTDYVFGGDPYNTPCREDQKGTPTGIYGITKLHGEQTIAESGCKALIFRTAWLYSEYGKNFVKTMLNLTATKPTLQVVFDQTGTPTYAQDLANAICNIIETRKFEGNEGIYHYSNEGVCSWFDFTKMIAEYAGNKNCDVRPCHSDEFPSAVKRPSYSVLDKTKFRKTFILEVPYWTDSLKICVKNLKSNEA